LNFELSGYGWLRPDEFSFSAKKLWRIEGLPEKFAAPKICRFCPILLDFTPKIVIMINQLSGQYCLQVDIALQMKTRKIRQLY